MTAAKRRRWACPTGAHPGVLGSTRPRRDDLVRYCLPCSIAVGRLIERTAPALERQRAAAADRAATRTKARRAARSAAVARAMAVETARYTVDGLDLRAEMERIRRLPLFAGTRVARLAPGFTVTRCRTAPRTCAGRAWPSEHRIHLSLWPTISRAKACATLVHELTHLWVGRDNRDSKAWHGEAFQRAMRAAFKAAYGIEGPPGYRGASSAPLATRLAQAQRSAADGMS